MSKLETNTIDNISGSTTLTIGSTNTTTVSIPEDVTLGASGKTITIPSGATITNSGTATGFAANTPAFMSQISANQSVSHDTQTKINFDTKIFDTDTNFDTTNKRFTPTTAGKYFLSCNVSLTGTNNRDYFFELRQSNLFFIGFLFLVFCIVWTLASGFATPIALFGGFVFGKWLGTLIVVVGMSIGATGVYLFANYFLKEIIRDKFLNKFQSLEEKFKKSELNYLLVYRFVGGIPFAISNVLPCIFNVKTVNFLIATLIGIVPQVFIWVSLGSGLEKIIDQNEEAPNFTKLITSPDIYIPIVAFVILVIVTIIIRKFFYRK